jgi:hypothetical protein
MDYQIPDFMIEKLIEAERHRRERAYQRPRLEIPVPPPIPYQEPPSNDYEVPQGHVYEVPRGPIIIDIGTYDIDITDEDGEQ